MTKRQEQDLAFIKDQNRWPNWPILPLKRHTQGMPTTAVLYGSEPLKLFVGANMWSFNRDVAREFKPRDVAPEDVIADGWEVD